MGYGGHFIVVHYPASLDELRFFGGLPVVLCGEPGDVHSHGVRPGDWHVLEVRYGLRDGEYWLGEWVEGTRAPAMIVSFHEGELCVVQGLETGPRAVPWAGRLHAASAADRYPTPKHRHLHPGLPPEWMIADGLLSGSAAVEALAGWSAATGGRADRAGLAALLAEEPRHFTEDVVLRLLDLIGLSEQVEQAPYPHLLTTWDDPVKLERSLTALQPGRYRALDCQEHPVCFALVRMRPEGDYELEYREQKPEVLYRTVTPSLDKVIAAMKDWAQGEVLWRDDFVWTPVSPVPNDR